MGEYRLLVAVEPSVLRRIYGDFCWEEYYDPCQDGYTTTFTPQDIEDLLIERGFKYNTGEFEKFKNKVFDITFDTEARCILDMQ